MSNHQAYTYCRTCQKEFHYLGIARHRAAHRERRERCVITFSDGRTETYHYDRKP